MLINPTNDEIKGKIIENLTIYFNDNIGRYNKDIDYFIVNANKNGVIGFDEMFIKNLLLKNFEEIIMADLLKRYEEVLINYECYEDWNNHLILNVINNIPLNNGNNTYLQEKLDELYRTIISNFSIPYYYYLINCFHNKIEENFIYINNKLNTNSKIISLATDKYDNNYKHLNYSLQRIDNYCENIDDKAREVKKTCEGLVNKITKLEEDYKKLETKLNNYYRRAKIILVGIKMITLSRILYQIFRG